MNQSTTTLQFVVAAVASIAVAGFTSWVSKPRPDAVYEELNTEFFPDLKPSDATGLRVITYNEATASAKPFTIEKKDGIWRIPSHHNYPADGKDRLAKTATSLLGIRRNALVSKVAADHERYGVIEPMDKNAESLKGRGQQITIYKTGDIAVADLIIGKKVEGRESFYVRKPNDPKVYIADLKVDLSTKFKDWVEDDLLKLERDNIVKLESVQNEITEDRTVKTVAQVLTREKGTDPWVLAGLNDESEELNKTDIDAMVTVIDNLKLVGIRKRPEFEGKPLLRSDLRMDIPAELRQIPQQARAIQTSVEKELGSKGFARYPDEKTDELRLYAVAGDLIASTNDGVKYYMSFGNVFSGSEDDIEKGAADEKAEGDAKAAEGEKKDSDKKDADKQSRYLFVRAALDESLLGPKPVQPQKPEVPAGVEVDENGEVVEGKSGAKPAPAKSEGKKPDAKPQQPADDAGCEALQEEKKEEAPKDEAKPEKKEPATEEKKPADAPAPEKKDDAKTAKSEPEAPKIEQPQLSPTDLYKAALLKYRSELARYKSDLATYEKKLSDAKDKVEKLNARFGDWYYVISAEDFDKLRLTRDQLVKAKEKSATETKDGDKSAPDQPADKPSAPKPAADAKPDAKPADEKKDADPKAPEAAKPDATKPAEAKPEGDANKKPE